MSRVAKWKVDKNKVKVVFRLQFHGTHIPQTGWNNLFISLVPVESGKATAKTNKASVRNGSCKWADPIYETTRLLQDSKTKQFEEKIYKLLVAMGTSRSSLLGEASINLSDYVDALKPTVVALPLQGNDSGATLHVTVQLLTSKTGFREFEQQREVSDSGLQTNSDHNNGKLLTTGDVVVSRLDKVNPRLKVKPDSKELPSLEKESGISEDYADSAAGFDGSSNTSGSLCAEKHEISSCREIDSIKSAISGEPGGISPTQSPRTDKGATDHCFLQGGTSEWIHRWGAENSTNSEIAIVYEENHRLREALEVADVSIHELRKEISSLQTCAEDIGVEAQNLTKKISIEIAADQELVKEISLLKSECSRFKDDLEWLKTLKLKPQIPKTVDTDQCNVIQDMSMRWIKGLQVAEDKIKEVQEKVHLSFNGKDSMLLHTDLEALLSILQDLKRGTEGCIYQFDDVSSGKAKASSMLNSSITDHVIADTGLGVELCHPEGVLLPGLLASGASSVDPTNAMQGEIFKLLRELDESKSEKDGLLRKMDQMECYYEALIQELEENQKQILGELQSLRNEHSSCIYTVSSTKAQMEAIHQQMSNELLQLAEERCNLDALNKELERRALASEAALRRARLNYSIAVNQLQKDLGVLSLQVNSMYETNENLIRRTFSEAAEPLLQGSQDAIPTGLAEDSDLDKVMVSQSHNAGVKSQLLGSDIFLEDLKRSLGRQEELIGKIQEEVSELLLANVYLDVFSVSLLENLVEATSRSKVKEVEMCELSKHLEFSSKENETLKVKLQNITDQLVDLSEEKVSLVSRCNDLVLKNEKLEATLSSISHEKLDLDVKIGEMGNLLSDYKSYKNNYEICNAEKLELANLLELATAEKGNLSKEVSLLQEELIRMKNEISSKELLQNIVDYLREKLEDLLVHGNEQVDDTHLGRTEDMKNGFEHFKTIMLQLEKFHQNLHDKICVLVKEKEDLLNEHDVAKLSLASASTEVEVVKQKFQHDLEDMVNKLDASTTLVEDLQRNLEIVGEKLKLSTEAEEKYMRMTQDLLSDFTKMDASLEELNFKCKDLAEETMALGSVTEELIGSKLTIDRITQENLDLNDLLLNKTNESSMLTLELDNLKGNVGSLQDELYLLRGIRDNLEADVLNLKAELRGRDERLNHVDQQNAVIIQLKQRISDIELEKASLCHQLSIYEENLKKESVGFTAADLEIQLINMHEFVIASDVTCTFIMKQYKDHAAELLHHLEYSNQQCLDLKKKNFDLISTLNSCIARNEIFAEENSTLMSNLQSLRSDLESNVTLNRDLEQTISEKAAELEEYKNEKDLLKTSSDDAIAVHQCDVRELKSLLGNCQKENDDLIIQKEETEIRVLMLKALVEEMSSNSGLREKCSEQMTMLKKQCSDLTRKLSEQVLKTEEFKNLSIHLKELKDKSVEKKEAEGSSIAMQESLRIAFIKEQCETKIQELKYQLSISKKHGEEMLWKLQDALDELETRKKREASQLKRNEELLSKIGELEAELQSMLSENRERFMAYEQLKAELDCSVMSLDCCKEEKKQLMASLQESNVENSRLTDEIELMREQIENMKYFMKKPTHNEDGCHIVQTGSKELSDFGNSLDNSPLSRSEALDEGISRKSSDDQANHLSHSMTLEIESDNEESMNLLAEQDALVTTATEDSSRDSEHAAPLHDQMKGKTLLACIERLQKELDVMRNENTLLEHENSNGLDSEGLQREQMHLQKVSKELGDMSSLYNDSSRSGNSVERVLALELELAEALQAKKSTVQFQSSFLKLHSDEAAVFQSFRDINELIKDMLEMKERYGTLEVQLKEMHERYSQLSLDFAEVEGERQRLTMTLKNVRPSKRLLSWPQSSSHKVSSP